MKDIYYYGSLTDDINLIKQKEKDIDKLAFRRTVTAVLTILLDILWLALGMASGRFSVVCIQIWGTHRLATLFIDIIKDKIKDIEASITTIEKKIEEFCGKLHVKNYNAKDLKADVDYETFKNAIIVEIPKSEDNKESQRKNVNNNVIDDVEVLINDIYYLDLDNQINALREVKKIITLTDEKSLFGLKVISKRKSKYYCNVTLQELENKDFPSELPVNITLRLK